MEYKITNKGTESMHHLATKQKLNPELIASSSHLHLTIMETAAHILASLVCSKCEQLLKRGPVYQQHDGAAVCGPCQAREDAQPASRCLLYEATAELLRFPCRYREEGCPDTVPFVAAGSTGFTHEDVCEYRQYVCPVLGSNRCDWAGCRNQLLQHCQDEHPDRVLSNPSQVTPNIRSSQITDYVISAFHVLFLLHTRVCLRTAKLNYAVRLFGNQKLASNYSYTVTVRRDENVFCWSRDVLPQELLVLQEHSALNLSTNSLLSMLGGWEGTSLSVEVKPRGPQAESEQEQAQCRQAGQEREQCINCRVRTPRLYRNEQGWLCAGCAPEKKTCQFEGCDFEDIGMEKREKHSDLFCQRRTSCYMCNAILQPGTPWQQHYTTCEDMKVIPAGSRFLIKRSNGWACFLVDTAAGHMVCLCKYTQDNYTLLVWAPVPCEQLHLLHCEVQLECAGNTRTHTPDTVYNNSWDWEIEYKNDNFFTNPEVHVRFQFKIE